MPLHLLIAGGIGALLSGIAALLITGRREARVMAGGALVFVCAVLAIICAQAVQPRSTSSPAEDLLDELIRRNSALPLDSSGVGRHSAIDWCEERHCDHWVKSSRS